MCFATAENKQFPSTSRALNAWKLLSWKLLASVMYLGVFYNLIDSSHFCSDQMCAWCAGTKFVHSSLKKTICIEDDWMRVGVVIRWIDYPMRFQRAFHFLTEFCSKLFLCPTHFPKLAIDIWHLEAFSSQKHPKSFWKCTWQQSSLSRNLELWEPSSHFSMVLTTLCLQHH